MTEPIIQLEALAHDHGQGPVFAIDEATLGTGLTVLQGPNGSGKTTLLRILATLLTPTQGTATVAGHDTVDQGPQVRTVTGFAGHTPSLHPELTVTQNLTLHARLHHLPEARVDHALTGWGLDAQRDRPVAHLSHGLARRVDLARATLHDPDVLLLDEPTAGLDAAATEALTSHLDQATARLVLLATHQAPPVDPDRVLTIGPEGLQEAST